MNIKDGLKFGLGFGVGKAIGELLYGVLLVSISKKERPNIKDILNGEDK